MLIVSHAERLREVADRVLWLEDGRFKEMRGLERDPVCGMLLDPAQARASSELDGKTYYFCANGCRAEFEREHPTDFAVIPDMGILNPEETR